MAMLLDQMVVLARIEDKPENHKLAYIDDVL
jgi:hypothetical protein